MGRRSRPCTWQPTLDAAPARSSLMPTPRVRRNHGPHCAPSFPSQPDASQCRRSRHDSRLRPWGSSTLSSTRHPVTQRSSVVLSSSLPRSSSRSSQQLRTSTVYDRHWSWSLLPETIQTFIILTRVRGGTRGPREAREVLTSLGLHVLESEIPLLEAYAWSFGALPPEGHRYGALTDELMNTVGIAV